MHANLSIFYIFHFVDFILLNPASIISLREYPEPPVHRGKPRAAAMTGAIELISKLYGNYMLRKQKKRSSTICKYIL
jgi:hypothetical protein